MKQHCILAAGLACIDVIRKEQQEMIAIGGTALNVLSLLSVFGNRGLMLLPQYSGNAESWFCEELESRRIRPVYYKKTKQEIPRILEEFDPIGDKHVFFTKCPKCGRDYHTYYPTEEEARKCLDAIRYGLNLFFFDRTSQGIRTIAEENRTGWNYYEPNSGRSLSAIMETLQYTDILKVSEESFSARTITHMVRENNNMETLKLIIVTMGKNGLKYMLRNKNDSFGEWRYIKAEPATNIVDSSGAGDWLSAAFIHRFLQKYPGYTQELDPEYIHICLERATAVASLSCGYVGAQGALFSDDAIKMTERLIGNVVTKPKTKTPDWRAKCEICKV